MSCCKIKCCMYKFSCLGLKFEPAWMLPYLSMKVILPFLFVCINVEVSCYDLLWVWWSLNMLFKSVNLSHACVWQELIVSLVNNLYGNQGKCWFNLVQISISMNLVHARIFDPSKCLILKKFSSVKLFIYMSSVSL